MSALSCTDEVEQLAVGRGDQTVIERLVTYKVAGLALVVVVLGVALMYISNLPDLADSPGWVATLNQLGGLFITTGVLAVLWDLKGKRAFLEEVLDKAKLSSDVDAAGIERVTMNWKEIPWDEFFSSANHIEVFIAYGSSWRKNNWESIVKFAQNEKHVLRMYLPNPQDEATMRILAQRYEYTPEKIQAYIEEASEEFARLGINSKADIRVYYRSGDPTYTCYRFNEKFLVTLYANRRERGGVPTMLFDAGGTFGEFFKRDLEAVREQSREISLQELVQKQEDVKT